VYLPLRERVVGDLRFLAFHATITLCPTVLVMRY
jgi:hypothetical protein